MNPLILYHPDVTCDANCRDWEILVPIHLEENNPQTFASSPYNETNYTLCNKKIYRCDKEITEKGKTVYSVINVNYLYHSPIVPQEAWTEISEQVYKQSLS